MKSVEELKNTFGYSTKLVESAVKALSGLNESSSSLSDITSSIEEAIQVAGATYEFNTLWGNKITDPRILIPTSLLVIYNTYSLSEFLRAGLSIRAWWNTQRMSRIVTTSAWLFGLANVALKLLGLSETVFHVTPKDRDEHGEGAHGAANASRFTFDESPVFVPGTALVMLHVIGLVVGISRWVRNGDRTVWIGEVVCCVWVVASFMPFVKGLVRKGKYGVPWSVVGKAGVLVGLLVNYSYKR